MPKHAIPPGEILKQDFMKPLGLTVQQLARDLHVPGNQLTDVIAGKRPRPTRPCGWAATSG